MFKRGHPELAKNFRRIATLPILCTCFSRMLRAHLADYVITCQYVDQAASRTSFNTVDHLLTASLLIENTSEYTAPFAAGPR